VYLRHKVKVKFALEQAMKAQRGEKRYSSTVSLTSALERGRWSTPHPGCFTPRKYPVPIVQEAACAPGPVWFSISGIVLCNSNKTGLVVRETFSRQNNIAFMVFLMKK
jgi:hypothetical protein